MIIITIIIIIIIIIITLTTHVKWHYHTSCLELINKAILLTHEVYVRLLYLIKCLISPAHQVCFVLLLTFLKYLKIFSPYKLILMLVTIETNKKKKLTWRAVTWRAVTRRDVSKRKKPHKLNAVWPFCDPFHVT